MLTNLAFHWYIEDKEEPNWLFVGVGNGGGCRWKVNKVEDFFSSDWISSKLGSGGGGGSGGGAGKGIEPSDLGDDAWDIDGEVLEASFKWSCSVVLTLIRFLLCIDLFNILLFLLSFYYNF